MRITSLKTRWIYRNFSTIPSLQWYVEKLTFSTYVEALNARAMVKKYFGPMEIKEIKGGFALYTRSKSVNPFSSHRRKVLKAKKLAASATDTHGIGKKVRLTKHVESYWLKRYSLDFKTIYIIRNIHSRGSMDNNVDMYSLKRLDGSPISGVYFYRKELTPA